MTATTTVLTRMPDEAQRSGPKTGPDPQPRFLSEAACREIVARLARLAKGGGYTAAKIWSVGSGHVRWARNQISSSGDVRMTYIQVNRDLRGANHGEVLFNETSDVALVAGARRAERLARLSRQNEQWDLVSWFEEEPATTPQLFSEATYQLDAEHRVAAVGTITQKAATAGVLSAGFIEVAAHSMAFIDTLGHVRYCPYTTASYSVTVRDPQGQGSGWAGVDMLDWSRIDTSKITQAALDKCLQARHPVAIEPGRYTTILEPQAVCDFVGQMFFDRSSGVLSFPHNWGNLGYPFEKRDPHWPLTRLGERVVDERITISADPMDPELGFPPFDALRSGELWIYDWLGEDVFHPTTWIKDGVLTTLAHHRDGFDGPPMGRQSKTGHPNSGAFRMSGGTTSIEEMITTTKRGVLVTRLDRLLPVDVNSQLYRGYTRDGLWLIENGKISKAIKNMMFLESILFALNNVEQLGVPQRVYHPMAGRVAIPQPVIVPPLKIKDFSFIALADAV